MTAVAWMTRWADENSCKIPNPTGQSDVWQVTQVTSLVDVYGEYCEHINPVCILKHKFGRRSVQTFVVTLVAIKHFASFAGVVQRESGG